MDSPATNTSSQRSARRPYSASTHSYQSCQRVTASSCQMVPCPGSRGSATVWPASATCRAHSMSDEGLLVKPWQNSTPTRSPSWWKGWWASKIGMPPS